jgi:hypothetical protein
MSRSEKRVLVVGAIAPHLAAANHYATAPLAVKDRCAYCKRPAVASFHLRQLGWRRVYVCQEHKGHEQT